MAISCAGRRNNDVVQNPWGDTADTIDATDFDLEHVQAAGELIFLTVSGPDTYYEYHGRELGLQYLLCKRFAQSIGVRLRVDLCKDTAEMINKLIGGEGDIASCMAHGKENETASVMPCGPYSDDGMRHWAVGLAKPLLAEAITKWYKPNMWSQAKRDENIYLSNKSITRRSYSPMLNKASGVISKYDALFMKYSRPIGWDWKLMASQCYQESAFDPMAKSWAGACGLMQVMPSTAEKLALPLSQIYDPERNIAAAAKYLSQLEAHFRDIPNRHERQNFVLASYNGGVHHIRDAMALAKSNNKSIKRWRDVEPYVLMLMKPEGYQHPAVSHGYMRGSETVDYVAKIRLRWNEYRKAIRGKAVNMSIEPSKATNNKTKFDI